MVACSIHSLHSLYFNGGGGEKELFSIDKNIPSSAIRFEFLAATVFVKNFRSLTNM